MPDAAALVRLLTGWDTDDYLVVATKKRATKNAVHKLYFTFVHKLNTSVAHTHAYAQKKTRQHNGEKRTRSLTSNSHRINFSFSA